MFFFPQKGAFFSHVFCLFKPAGRTEIEGAYYPRRQYEGLNTEESELLDAILSEIKRLHPEVHKELIRNEKV